MANEPSIRRMRNWYAVLLRLYPKRYRERFAEPMEQTFNDLLRERAKKGTGLFGFALWLFVETFRGAMGENMAIITMQHKALFRIALVTASILLLPLLAMLFTDEVVWNLTDFVVAGALLIGAGLTYELIAGKGGNFVYRAAVGVAVAAGLLLVWVNLAVGIIGDAENPANLMYIGVLAIGIAGTFIARFQPAGMARTLFATALAQAVVATIVLVAGLDSSPARSVLIINGFFASLFVGSALLFRQTAQESN